MAEKYDCIRFTEGDSKRKNIENIVTEKHLLKYTSENKKCK